MVQGKPSWDETGVSALIGEARVNIAWHEITAIYAYKKDCFAFDQIRLIIAGKDRNIEFTEDDADVDGLRIYISNHLAVREDWYQTLVLSPAFEKTWTVVYPDSSSTEIEVAR